MGGYNNICESEDYEAVAKEKVRCYQRLEACQALNSDVGYILTKVSSRKKTKQHRAHIRFDKNSVIIAPSARCVVVLEALNMIDLKENVQYLVMSPHAFESEDDEVLSSAEYLAAHDVVLFDSREEQNKNLFSSIEAMDTSTDKRLMFSGPVSRKVLHEWQRWRIARICRQGLSSLSCALGQDRRLAFLRYPSPDTCSFLTSALSFGHYSIDIPRQQHNKKNQRVASWRIHSLQEANVVLMPRDGNRKDSDTTEAIEKTSDLFSVWATCIETAREKGFRGVSDISWQDLTADDIPTLSRALEEISLTCNVRMVVEAVIEGIPLNDLIHPKND